MKGITKFVVMNSLGEYGYGVESRGSNKNLSFTKDINCAELFTERSFKQISDHSKNLVFHKLAAEETRKVMLIREEILE